MAKRRQPAPKHLSTEAQRWWQSVVADFVLEPHHCKILQLAAEAWDRSQQARDAIAQHGTTFTDRFGQPHARPEVGIERDSRLGFARLIRELDLDVQEPTPGRSRPPALRSNSRRFVCL